MLTLLTALLIGQAPAPTPTSTRIGVYINQVAGIDLKASQYTVDFWVWFRGPDRAVSPVDTFEIINGRINSKTNIIKKKMADGANYAAARINATVYQNWDLRRYPLDNHRLELVFEDSEIDSNRGVFVVDQDGQGLDPSIAVSGWEIARALETKVVDHRYDSNYGDLSVSQTAEIHFSRYEVRIAANRSGLARYFKVFFALLISVLVSWCAFFIRPKDASPRVSVSVGALFAGAAGTLAINNQLPDLNYLTLTDKTVFLCLGMILLSLVGTVLSLTLNYLGNESGWKRVDRYGAIAFPILFLVTLLVVIN